MRLYIYLIINYISQIGIACQAIPKNQDQIRLVFQLKINWIQII